MRLPVIASLSCVSNHWFRWSCYLDALYSLLFRLAACNFVASSLLMGPAFSSWSPILEVFSGPFPPTNIQILEQGSHELVLAWSFPDIAG